jgi:hypothetical protein
MPVHGLPKLYVVEFEPTVQCVCWRNNRSNLDIDIFFAQNLTNGFKLLDKKKRKKKDAFISLIYNNPELVVIKKTCISTFKLMVDRMVSRIIQRLL